MSLQTYKDLPQLPKRWLKVARVAWLLITGVGIVMFAIGAQLYFQKLATTCAGSDCLRQQLAPEVLPSLADIGLTLTGYAALVLMPTIIFAVVSVAIGALIFWQRSHELMAYFSSLWLVTFGLTLFEEEVRATGAAYPWLQPVTLVLIMLGGTILLPLFFFIFPNGRFALRWTKWAWLIISVFFASSQIAISYFPSSAPILLGFVGYVWFTMVLVCIVVQFYRYRYLSTANERQQTKWVIIAFLVIVVVFVTLLLVNPLLLDFRVREAENIVRNIISNAIASSAFLMIPIGIGISILRHRLFDIDVIIRRTLIYGLLSASLAIIYFGLIILSQSAFRTVTAQDSQLVIVLSTLLIAALFTPLRRGIQNLIDRRFYRQKYDAEKVLNAFALKARDEVELDVLTQELA